MIDLIKLKKDRLKYSKIPLAQTIVKQCKAKGIANIIISPGSRNAPLTISFTNDPFFNCFSIVDERCAAFFALGIAQQLKAPVAVLCSSGSALLNYYPAISEAFYSNIPLVVISADRPTYKIDIGDGQTIRQEQVYTNHIVAEANLIQDVSHAVATVVSQSDLLDDDISQDEVEALNIAKLDTAFSEMFRKKGPIHINAPFEEPLYETVEVMEEELTQPIKIIPIQSSELDDIEEVATLWSAASKKIILVGVLQPGSIEEKFVNKLATDSSVLIFTESTSNLHHDNIFSSIDQLIAPIEKHPNADDLFEELTPDILLTFGGMVVSKKVKSFLRTYQPEHHWHIDEGNAYNSFFCLSHHFKCTANLFFDAFLKEVVAKDSTYFPTWNAIRNKRLTAHKDYLTTVDFSDFLAFSRILKSIPEHSQLQLANSSTIRYVQLFNLIPNIKVFCNRGTSGIDGSTSTAIGAAVYHKEATVFITGDISFFYDSNALWNNYMRSDFRIILINNNGGGIFRILPGVKEQPESDTYFETTHQLKAKQLCTMYGVSYQEVTDGKSLDNALKTFYDASESPKLLEVTTPRLKNDEILLNYFGFLAKKS